MPTDRDPGGPARLGIGIRLGLVFDLDGTLIDSRRDIAEATNHALRAHGFQGLSSSEIASYVGDGAPRVFPNVELPGVGAMPCGDTSVLLAQTNVTWKDLGWIRDAWRGPIIVKGVHTGDVARQAVDAGADAVVVSNHGGRQLDGVAASIRALPEVVAAVGDGVDVLMDGGIRRGADIIKARCLGARAVLIGRAYGWALGAAGGPGVARAIDILKADLVRTLRLLGCASVRELDGSFIDVPWVR